jgi:hypothetical protein
MKSTCFISMCSTPAPHSLPDASTPDSPSTPLLPRIAPQATTNPLLQLLKWCRHLAEAIIRPPAAQGLAQSGYQTAKAHAQRAARPLLHRPTQCLQRLVADSPVQPHSGVRRPPPGRSVRGPGLPYPTLLEASVARAVPGARLSLVSDIDREAATARTSTGHPPLGLKIILSQALHHRPERIAKSARSIRPRGEQGRTPRALRAPTPGSWRLTVRRPRSSEKGTEPSVSRPAASCRPCHSSLDRNDRTARPDLESPTQVEVLDLRGSVYRVASGNHKSWPGWNQATNFVINHREEAPKGAPGGDLLPKSVFLRLSSFEEPGTYSGPHKG